MPTYPFPHDTRVHLISDGKFQVAYYARDRKKFKRVRDMARQTWQQTIEEAIDDDSFWMIVACAELAKHTRR